MNQETRVAVRGIKRMGTFLELFLSDFPKGPQVDKAPVFYSDNTIVFKARSTLDQEACLNSYQFVLVGQDPFSVRLENRTFFLKSNRLFPINPGQPHCATKAEAISEYLPMFINRQFLADLAYDMFSENKLVFQNTHHVIAPKITYLVQQFILECTHQQPGKDLILQCLDTEIAVTLLRCIHRPDSIELHSTRRMVKLAESYIRESCMTKLSLDDLARLTNYSPHHFLRIFKAETGKTPIEYLLDVKIEKAEHLLKNKELSITDICHMSGFNSISHFSTTFMKKKGVSPSSFRRQLYC